MWFPFSEFCNIIRYAQQTVKYFFWSLIEKGKTVHNKYNDYMNYPFIHFKDRAVRSNAVHRAYQMLARQSSAQKAARTIALRELIEGALFIYGNLFGAHTESNYLDQCEQRRDSELLLKINQKQGNAPSAIRSILHAGIIGQGLKVPTKQASKPDPELQNAYLNALSACCKSSVRTQTVFQTV